MSEQHTERKRRRRRRRKRAASDIPALIQVIAEEEDDTAPLTPSKPKGGSITLDLPARFLDILQWGASTRRQPIEKFATEILRGVLSGMKPAYREAMTGSLGGSARKGQEFNRLTERMRPDGQT